MQNTSNFLGAPVGRRRIALGEDCKCSRCGFPGSDVRVVGCGCTMHSRCMSLSILVKNNSLTQSFAFPTQAESTAQLHNCPVCSRGPMKGLYMFPLTFRDLEEACVLRRRCASSTDGSTSTTDSKAKSKAKNRDDSLRKQDQMSGPPCGDGSDLDDSARGETRSTQLAGSIRKRGEDYDDELSYAEDMQKLHASVAPFLMLSNPSNRDTLIEKDHYNFRTGRWTSEETAYVDHLIRLFDSGVLPLPHGVKLNEFLSDMLLCKSSRLTKKMKNAKLSTRSYSLVVQAGVAPAFCYGTLSRLQELFLKSVSSDPTRLEMRFNMTRMWRTHLSNLCLQLGYDSLQADDWVASLEEMERRATAAEEVVRKARRKRMGLALKRDVEQEALDGVFIQGVSAKNARGTTLGSDSSTVAPADALSSQVSLGGETSKTLKSGRSNSLCDDGDMNDEDDFLLNIMAASPAPLQKSSFPTLPKERSNSDELSLTFDTEDLLQGGGMNGLYDSGDTNESLGDCGPFLGRVVEYLEASKLPFQHVDVWVPAFLPPEAPPSEDAESPPSLVSVFQEEESNEVTTLAPSSSAAVKKAMVTPVATPATSPQLRLCHAGQATRSDLPAALAFQLNEFGIYSTNYSFAPDVGLPGRVYVAGVAQWETNIDNASPDHFKRCGGAKHYGVKTVCGIPVNSPTIGRIVVAMYSTSDLEVDENLMKTCTVEFQRHYPEPAWRLVIDLGPASLTSESETKTASISAREGGVTEAVNNGGAMSLEKEQENDLQTSLAKTSVVSGQDQSQVHPNVASMTDPKGESQRGNQAPPDQASRGSSVPVTFISHAGTPPNPSGASGTAMTIEEDDDEHEIATLLGEHMPMTGGDSVALLQSFVSLRLLLLQTALRRSEMDNDLLNIIKRSYKGYTKVNKRNGSEVALLLAKDWMFLRGTSCVPRTAANQGNSFALAGQVHHVNYSTPAPAPSSATNANISTLGGSRTTTTHHNNNNNNFASIPMLATSPPLTTTNTFLLPSVQDESNVAAESVVMGGESS